MDTHGEKRRSNRNEKEKEEVPRNKSKWLWLVRLCFDRRSRVRVLSLEILGMVMKRTPASTRSAHSEGGVGSGSEQVVQLGEFSSPFYSL